MIPGMDLPRHGRVGILFGSTIHTARPDPRLIWRYEYIYIYMYIPGGDDRSMRLTRSALSGQ